MAKKKKEKKEQCPINFKPLEGTILKYKGKKEKKGRCPIWIKEEHIEYEIELKKLQIELMKLQKSMKTNGNRILAIFEGRDAAGKGGTIKRITAFLNPVVLPALCSTFVCRQRTGCIRSFLVQPGHGRTGDGFLYR